MREAKFDKNFKIVHQQKQFKSINLRYVSLKKLYLCKFLFINGLSRQCINIIKMSNRGNQRKISQVIFATLLPHLTGGGSCLSELQEIYSAKRLSFKQQISQRGRTLTKKLFGTAIRCINLTSPLEKFANSPNLVALAYIFLKISFQDEDVLKLILQQLNQSEAYIKKLFQIHNPYSSLNIDASQFQKILAQIILKINSLRSIFSIGDILKDYYIATETFSLFLRLILCKLNYTNAQFCQKKLQKTSQIFTILCEYFDIIMIARKQNNSLKTQKNQADKSEIYLFNNYNLFISSVDNNQFCAGKYYNNETELINSQKQIRKSIVQFLFKKDGTLNNIRNEKCLNQSEINPLRLSQVQMDLGLSTSAMMSNISESTPFFSSNLSTPQFGKLFESKQFRKSIDSQMQSPSILPENEQNHMDELFNDADSLNLGTVEQQINTPNSQANYDGKDELMFQKKQKSYFERCEQMLMKKFAPYILADSVKGKIKMSPGYDSPTNKPLSPPSIPAIKMPRTEQKQKQTKKFSNFNFYFNEQNSFQSLSKSKQKNKQMTIQIKQVSQNKQSFQYKKTYQINNNDDNKLILKFTQKPKFVLSQQSQSPLRAQQKKNDEYFAKANEQNQNQNMLKMKKKDVSHRKYSINEQVTNQFKEINKKISNIHHSNHFVNQEIVKIQNQKLVQQLALTQQNNIQVISHEFQKQQNKSLKKMQLTSNIINVKVSNFQHKTPKKEQLITIQRNYLKAQLLRNSKSSKSSRIPQNDWDYLQKSRNVSEHIYSSKKKRANPNEMLVNSIVSQKILTLKAKQESMSPRFSKANKFPQFLRNANKGIHKLNKQTLIKQKKQIQQRVKKLNLKCSTDQKLLKKSSFKKATTQQNELVLRNNMSPRHTVDANTNIYKKQSNPENNVQSQNQRMKHIKSQPRLAYVVENQTQFPANNNLLSNDYNHRPWISIPRMQNFQLRESKTESVSSRQSLNQPDSQQIQQYLRPTIIRSLVVTQQKQQNPFKNTKQPYSPTNMDIRHNNSPIKPIISFQATPPPIIFFNVPVTQSPENQSSRISHQLQNSIIRAQSNFIDQNHTSKSSMVISKTDCFSPSTQWSGQNEILMRSSNYRKHIWENAFNTKNW